MKKKKSQQDITNAASAGALIMIILVIIVAYIIIIPPQERAKLLEEENGDKVSEPGEKPVPSEKGVLLLEYPGRVDVVKDRDVEHEISAFRLYRATSSEEIESINPFIVRKSLFDTANKEIKFSIKEPDNTDNVMLSFSLKSFSGILEIKLNGESIFQSELTEKNPKPIRLRKEHIKENNVLEFSVSGTGARFWSTNMYSFDNVRITADVTDTSRQESTNVFSLKKEEAEIIESATLRYFPDCRPEDVGRLEIKLNYHEIFSGVPDCGSVNVRNLPANIFRSGDNNIIFKTEKGDYLIEQIRIRTRLREEPYPMYYFQINESLYQKVFRNEAEIRLTMKFVDDRKTKRLNLNVNNRLTSIDTIEGIYIRNINIDIVKGNNFIKLEPLSTLDVIEVKVEIV